MTLRERLPGRGTCKPENCPASEGLLARAAQGAFAAGCGSKERHVIGWTAGHKQAAGRKEVVDRIVMTINRSLQKSKSSLAVAHDALRDVHTSSLCVAKSLRTCGAFGAAQVCLVNLTLSPLSTHTRRNLTHISSNPLSNELYTGPCSAKESRPWLAEPVESCCASWSIGSVLCDFTIHIADCVDHRHSIALRQVLPCELDSLLNGLRGVLRTLATGEHTPHT